MNTNNKDIKPFYIYTDKNCLYMKNINEHTEKLSNNIHTYSANIDNNQKIHVCGIDTSGKLIHFYNNNGYWKKKVICKTFSSIKNIKNMRLYIINNLFNVFIVEDYPLSENLYRVTHFNFNLSNYKISKYHINNILKDNSSFYKLSVDDLSNIIFEYKSTSSTRDFKNNTLIFNTTSRSWLNPTTLLRGGSPLYDNPSPSDIKSDIFEYCYSITYKS